MFFILSFLVGLLGSAQLHTAAAGGREQAVESLFLFDQDVHPNQSSRAAAAIVCDDLFRIAQDPLSQMTHLQKLLDMYDCLEVVNSAYGIQTPSILNAHNISTGQSLLECFIQSGAPREQVHALLNAGAYADFCNQITGKDLLLVAREADRPDIFHLLLCFGAGERSGINRFDYAEAIAGDHAGFRTMVALAKWRVASVN